MLMKKCCLPCYCNKLIDNPPTVKCLSVREMKRDLTSWRCDHNHQPVPELFFSTFLLAGIYGGEVGLILGLEEFSLKFS